MKKISKKIINENKKRKIHFYTETRNSSSNAQILENFRQILGQIIILKYNLKWIKICCTLLYRLHLNLFSVF